VFCNKLDEEGKVVRSKVLAQGYITGIKGTNFTKDFVLVARLKVIVILLAFATYKNNIFFFQMDVKSFK